MIFNNWIRIEASCNIPFNIDYHSAFSLHLISHLVLDYFHCRKKSFSWFGGYCIFKTFSNSLYVNLGILKSCFSFSLIFGFSWSFSILDDVNVFFFHLHHKPSSWRKNKFFYSWGVNYLISFIALKCAFSTWGRVVSLFCSCLTSKIVELLIFM